MISKFLKFSSLCLVLLFLFACQKNPLDIALNQKIETKVIRFDQELMQVDTSHIFEAVSLFSQKYPIFFPSYTHAVLGIGGPETRDFNFYFKKFISAPISRNVYKEIQKKYPDVNDVKENIDLALSYYHHYFAEEAIPDLYFFQSGFNQRIIIDSLVIGIALDMCLGSDNPYYDSLALPQYLSAKMNRENIALDAMRGLAWSNFIFEGEDNLACNMIYEGKIQYFLMALFPKQSHAKNLLYSDKQYEWLEKNEKKIWETMIQEEMLYQNDHMKIKNMISDAPFTQAFGNDSPPKVGVWLGWKIVKSYMEEHPEVSLKDLMKNTDYIAILNESNYKP